MRLIIDTDPAMGTLGSDPEDGMAILYALNSPDAQVDGLTLVQGNVPISHSWANARHLLALAGYPDLPVHAGAVAARDRCRAWIASYRDSLAAIASARSRSKICASSGGSCCRPSRICTPCA